MLLIRANGDDMKTGSIIVRLGSKTQRLRFTLGLNKDHQSSYLRVPYSWPIVVEQTSHILVIFLYTVIVEIGMLVMHVYCDTVRAVFLF